MCLCADKTGTLTQNALTVTTILPMLGLDEALVLALAVAANSDGGQDPVAPTGCDVLSQTIMSNIAQKYMERRIIFMTEGRTEQVA